MPDLLGYKISVQTDWTPTVAIPRFTLEARVVDSDNQSSVIVDATGANNIDFVLRVQGFTKQQHRELVDYVAHKILRMKAGIE